MNRFKKHYETVVTYDLLFKDHFINVMQLPKLDHITLNTGIGIKAILDKKQLIGALLGLEYISNQRPIITRAKKSIDKFKLREKMAIGCKITLRKNNLFKFMDRFINTVLPTMDNSHELFNSVYFKNYLLKREKYSFYKNNLILKTNNLNSNLISLENDLNKTPFLIDFKKINNDSQTNIAPYLKWSNNIYMACSKDLRSKLWLSYDTNLFEQNTHFLNWKKKKFFLPYGKDYIFLNLNNLQNNFLQHHNFKTFFTQKIPLGFFNKKIKFKKYKNLNNNNKHVHYSTSFGLKDFISSTWLSNFGCNSGDIETTHGIDIIFVTRLLKNNSLNLSKPQYFLSNFQMPF